MRLPRKPNPSFEEPFWPVRTIFEEHSSGHVNGGPAETDHARALEATTQLFRAIEQEIENTGQADRQALAPLSATPLNPDGGACVKDASSPTTHESICGTVPADGVRVPDSGLTSADALLSFELVEVQCRVCHGAGMDAVGDCTRCNGSGVTTRKKRTKKSTQGGGRCLDWAHNPVEPCSSHGPATPAERAGPKADAEPREGRSSAPAYHTGEVVVAGSKPDRSPRTAGAEAADIAGASVRAPSAASSSITPGTSPDTSDATGGAHADAGGAGGPLTAGTEIAGQTVGQALNWGGPAERADLDPCARRRLVSPTTDATCPDARGPAVTEGRGDLAMTDAGLTPVASTTTPMTALPHIVEDYEVWLEAGPPCCIDVPRIMQDLGREVIPAHRFDRFSGIGASRIYDVVYDPMKVYCELRKIVEPMEDSDFLEAGRFMEPAIAAWFAHRKKVTLRGDGGLVVRHPTEPWIFASPDRFIYSEEKLVALLECKNVSVYRRDDWGTREDEDVPERYFFQVQWQMGVTGIRRCYLASVIGGNQPRFDNVIEFDADFFAALVKIARAFWFGNVIAGEAPEITGSESSRQYVRARFREVRERVLRTPQDLAETVALAEVYLDAAEKTSSYEKIKKEAQNKLCAEIGEAEGLVLDTDGWSATWRARQDGVRVFNLKKRKKVQS